MDRQTEQYAAYIRRLVEVRQLSTPSLDGVSDADDYTALLKRSFTEIGLLADQNRSFLSDSFFPLIRRSETLTHHESETLTSFGELLIDANNAENLDLPIMSLLSNRLLADARDADDQNELIRRSDACMDTCYALMIMTWRVSSCPEISEQYRQAGLEFGRYFLSLLDKDKFAGITDPECRAIVLTDARYSSVFYEHTPASSKDGCADLDLLDRMLEIAEDPFYHELVPGFNWHYFKYRSLHYYAKSTDHNNARGFDRKTLSRIREKSDQYMAFYQNDPKTCGMYDNFEQVHMVYERNRFLTGSTDRSEYIELLHKIYSERDTGDYELNGIYDNLLIPLEYICLLDPQHITEEENGHLQKIYQDLLQYSFRMPNNGTLTSLLEYLMEILELFIEMPGGMTFEEMGIQCMAALHPPTFIHSLSVAQLTECITAEAAERCPEKLIGILDTETAEQVKQRKDEIISFAYHAALCHDFGKLSIIDTVFVYGRNLLDMEFDLIRTHPLTGYNLLRKHQSTAGYGEAALFHHRFSNDQGGYPKQPSMEGITMRPLIDILRCADCLDAATDSVGRSYQQGKSFDDVLKEFDEGSGVQYAAWVVDLLHTETLAGKVKTLLTEGRKKNYRNTYYLLADEKDKN